MEDQVSLKPPRAWIDALQRADDDVAAGRTVPWTEVRARITADQAETETAPAKTPARRKA